MISNISTVNTSVTSGPIYAKASLSTTTECLASTADNSSLTQATASQSITTYVAIVPGEDGVPGCAYIVAADIGPSPTGCSVDYCDCGGIAAPLLSSPLSVGGTWTTDCSYTIQPATSSCPEPVITATGSLYFPPSPPPIIDVTVYVDPLGPCTSTLGGGEICHYTTVTA
jgi:hypothetical protein